MSLGVQAYVWHRCIQPSVSADKQKEQGACSFCFVHPGRCFLP